MNLTSEQVHWIGGGAFTLVALGLLAYESGALRGRWIPYLLPVLLVGYGVESLLDVLIHGEVAPASYGLETLQHYAQGGFMLAGGVIEALRLRGRLVWRGWGLAVPAALAALGVVFALHAQHDGRVPPVVMTVQHRFFAATLLVAAAAKAVKELRRAPAWSLAWLLPLLVFGLAMLLYTEGGVEQQQTGHSAVTTGPAPAPESQ